MSDPTVAAALDRLRAAADAVRIGIVPERWRRTAGSGPADVSMLRVSFADAPMCAFVGLGLASGVDTTVETELRVPPSLHGVDLAGDTVEMTLVSLFPMSVRVDGREVFSDDLPVVAAGPASFAVVDTVDPDVAVRLSARVVAPDAQINPDWVYVHLTTPRLRQRFLALDATWARLYVADALAETDADRKAVAAAADLVPADVLAAAPTFVDDVATTLAPLADAAAALRVHLVGHSHIDLAWLWTWDDTRRVIVRDVRSVLEMMDDYPELRFTHSQPATYESLRRDEPELFQAVCDRIAEGRWEAATMQWAEGDVNLATGEAQARQLLEGVRYSRERLDTAPTVFLAPDTFGHAGNLPQLARSAGATIYYHHRGNPGHRAGEGAWPAYWWEGDDGARLLAVSTPSYNGVELTPGTVATAAVTRSLRAGLPATLHFFGVGDHGGGPTRRSLDNLRWMTTQAGLPSAFCSTVADFASEVVAAGVTLPVANGETGTVFEGCYTTHVDTKRWNREGEDLLVAADALTAVAGLDHRAALREAWRTVLFHQFHDILDGSAIAEAYVDHGREAAVVRDVASAAIGEALSVLQAGAPGGTVVVTNPVAAARHDVVSMPAEVLPADVVDLPVGAAVRLVTDDGAEHVGQRTPDGVVVLADVAPFGTRWFRLAGGAPEISPMTVTSRPGAAAPDVGFVKVDAGLLVGELRTDCGVLTSLRDRRTGRDLVAWGQRRGSDYTDHARPDLALGVLQLVEEHPHGMSAWQHMEVFRETSILRGATVEVVEQGPVRVVVESRVVVGSSPVVQRWTFWRDLPRVDVALDVDWQEPGGPDVGVPNLKVAFTAAVDEPEAWYETPFAAARRPADGQQVPALRWAALAGPTGGLAVLNDGTHGHDALGHRLRLTVVRTAYEPDARSDHGPVSARLSLRPFVGDWRDAELTRAGIEWNQPLLVRAAPGGAVPTPTRATVPAPHVDAAGVAVTTVKHGVDGGLVVRLNETTGRARTVVVQGLPAGETSTATVTEDVVGPLPRAADGTVTVALRPFEVRTIVVR